MAERFIIYGLVGLIMEVLWTGACSFFKGDLCLRCTTSIWMFFIYGFAVFLEPIFIVLADMGIVLRGVIYMMLIYCAEYVSGYILERRGFCPWNYGSGSGSVFGLICIYYAPIWFAAGLIFETVYFRLV